MDELKVIEIAEKYATLDDMPENLTDLVILHAYSYYMDRLTREQFPKKNTNQSSTNEADTASIDAAIQKLIDEME